MSSSSRVDEDFKTDTVVMTAAFSIAEKRLRRGK